MQNQETICVNDGGQEMTAKKLQKLAGKGTGFVSLEVRLEGQQGIQVEERFTAIRKGNRKHRPEGG